MEAAMASGELRPPAAGLVDAIERLAGARSPEQVTEVLRGTARALVGCDGIAVVLRDGGYCHYVAEDAISPLWAGQRFPLETCISGWAMLNKQTATIPDVFVDARIPHELYRRTFVKSLVMTPVRRNDPLAAIGAYWGVVREPSPDEVALLDTVARAAATALDNVGLVAALSRSLEETEIARDELRHRIKNVFAATRAIVEQTLPGAHAKIVGGRLAAVSRAHELLDDGIEQRSSLPLKVLVSVELEAFSAGAPNRVAQSGPDVTLSSAQAVALGLALNELGTSALKHGALSSPTGRVDVRWRIESGRLALAWRESGGPPVDPAPAQGYGAELLRRLVEERLKGRVQRIFAPAGVSCVIDFPLDLKQAALDG